MDSFADKLVQAPHSADGDTGASRQCNGNGASHHRDHHSPHSSTEDAPGLPRTPRIVVGMDRSEAASATRAYLEDLGCECQCVDDVEGVMRLAETNVDGAVLGLQLGGLSTWDVLQRLPDYQLQPHHVLCHIARADGAVDDLVQVVRLGVHDVMIGGLNPAKVRRLVETLRSNARPLENGHAANGNGHGPSTNGNGNGHPASDHADEAQVTDGTRVHGNGDAAANADGHVAVNGNGHAPSTSNGHSRTESNGQQLGEVGSTVRPLETSSPDDDLKRTLIGDSAAMAGIRQTIVEVAKTRATVMVCGESGTGKEVVASAIHNLSRDARGPFVPVNMAAIPEGLAESLLFGHERGAFTSANKRQVGYCESANGGTLFMDEISEMELQIQPKLLRFLQTGMVHPIGSQKTRAVSTRIITATNCDPAQLVKSGRLREDLYFRLHVVPIYVPPLRERNDDIEQLAGEFLQRFAALHERDVYSFSDEAIEVLRGYYWPGNVRQLENIVERIVIFAKGSVVVANDVPLEIHAGTSPVDPLGGMPLNGAVPGLGAAYANGTAGTKLKPIQQRERTAIIEALQHTDGHVVDAAELLGISQATMYRKIKEYEISRERKRRKRSAN